MWFIVWPLKKPAFSLWGRCRASSQFLIMQSKAMSIADHILPLGDILGNVWSTGAFCFVILPFVCSPPYHLFWAQALSDLKSALSNLKCPHGINSVFSDLNSSLPSPISPLSSLKLALSDLNPSLLSLKTTLSHLKSTLKLIANLRPKWANLKAKLRHGR